MGEWDGNLLAWRLVSGRFGRSSSIYLAGRNMYLCVRQASRDDGRAILRRRIGHVALVYYIEPSLIMINVQRQVGSFSKGMTLWGFPLMLASACLHRLFIQLTGYTCLWSSEACGQWVPGDNTLYVAVQYTADSPKYLHVGRHFTCQYEAARWCSWSD